VAKYRLKLKKDDGREYDEEVQIDTQKETETFHVPKTSPDNEEADIVLDFKKVSEYRALALNYCRGQGRWGGRVIRRREY